jgi:signal transduction histidine kinase
MGEHEKADEEVRNVRRILVETVSEVRAVLADLSQELLSTYGLDVALRSHAERFSEFTGIKVAVQNELNRRFPTEIELLMYRLAQEALANIRKHSGAHNVVIVVNRMDDNLHMTISDDGKGFNVEDAMRRHEDGKGIGLRSMRQRIAAAGGNMEIISRGGQGTAIGFWCPVPDVWHDG